MNRRGALSALAAGIVAGTSVPAVAANDEVRCGLIPIEAGMQPVYATERGFAGPYGLTLPITTLSNGPALLAGIVGGSLDVGDVNWITILQARERGAAAGCRLARGGLQREGAQCVHLGGPGFARAVG